MNALLPESRLRTVTRDGDYREVSLPAGAVVNVDGHTVRIPAGETRMVLSGDHSYELVDWDRRPQSWLRGAVRRWVVRHL